MLMEGWLFLVLSFNRYTHDVVCPAVIVTVWDGGDKVSRGKAIRERTVRKIYSYILFESGRVACKDDSHVLLDTEAVGPFGALGVRLPVRDISMG